MNKFISFFIELLRIIIYSVIVIAIILNLLSVIFLTVGYQNDKKRMKTDKFDSEKFKAESMLRVFMADDLVKNYLRKGMRIAEVKELLGNNYNPRLYDKQNYKRICMNYTLGLLGGFKHDGYDLIICPDPTYTNVESFEIFWRIWWKERLDGGKEIFSWYPNYKELKKLLQ